MFSFPFGADARQVVSVSGRVVNRTRNTPVPGQEVTLVRHRAGAADQVKATAGADGVFRFEQVAVEDSASIVLTTSYLGVPYVASDVALKDGAASGIEIAVYDTTSSDAAVRADAYHIIVNAHGSAMEVMEILALRNDGEQTVYGSDGLSLRVPLPSGFTGLEVEPAASTPTATGFASRWPVPPGQTRLRFRYRLPAGDVFSRPIPYPASMVSVLIHPSDVAVQSRSLDNQGAVDFEGQKFLHLVGSSASRGAPVDFRVVGRGNRPEGSEETVLSRDTLKWGLLALAVLLGAAAMFYRPRRKAEEQGSRGAGEKSSRGAEERRSGGAVTPAPLPPRTPAGGETLEGRRAAVVRQIADLDDDYEAGRIDEVAYRKRRSDLKDEAVRLTEALRQGDG